MLELLHVEELHGPLRLEGPVGHFEDVVRDGVVFAAGGDLDVDVGLGDALDEDVAVLVHLDLAALQAHKRVTYYSDFRILRHSENGKSVVIKIATVIKSSRVGSKLNCSMVKIVDFSKCPLSH